MDLPSKLTNTPIEHLGRPHVANVEEDYNLSAHRGRRPGANVLDIVNQYKSYIFLLT